jgi:sulfatase modifying factor 1
VRASSYRRRAAWRWGLSVLAVSLALLAACAQIVGITDTPATSGESPDTGSEAGPAAGEGGNLLGEASPGADADAGSAVIEPTADAEGGSVAQPTADAEGGGVALESGTDGVTNPPRDGSADAKSQPPVDAGPDQTSVDAGGCPSMATRCGASGLETCQANLWKSTPCPINMPTCATGACTVRGPTMVQVGAFYIDSTEVTVAQYQAFLTAKGNDTSGQPAVCAWNKAYKDPTLPLESPTTVPMTNVDWCDALAYCTWAGKHLCGKIGGGPVASVDQLTPTASQWFLACGGPGGSPHPSAADICNANNGFGNLAPVATFPGCEGFYKGIFDMEGNAAEWVDSCDSTDAGPNDTCHLLGGGFYDMKSFCTESYDWPRNTIADAFGFRCCGG